MPLYQLLRAENELRKAASQFALCGLMNLTQRLQNMIEDLEILEEDIKNV